MQVVIDTNLWISFLIGKSLNELVNLIENNDIVILSSHELINEVLEVIERPKLQRYFSQEKKDFLIRFLTRKSHQVEVSAQTDACRDKKDNFILKLALSGDADYIVSGDKDLLTLDPFHNIRIINFSDFKEILLGF